MCERPSLFVAAGDDRSPVSHAEEQALMFVRTWAEEVLRQIARVEEVRKSVSAHYRMLGDEPGITEDFLEESFREQWAAEHTLVWAAFQLERWRDRLDLERSAKDEEEGTPEEIRREPDRQLRQVRNVLEHLDEADFVDGRAVAPPLKEPDDKVKDCPAGPRCPRKRRQPQDNHRALRKLDGLDISLQDGASFCGVESAELRERALGVVRSVEDELAEAALDHYAELLREH